MADEEIHVTPGTLQVQPSPRLELALRRQNPWWTGSSRDSMPLVPPFRRWLFKPVLDRLNNRFAPAITVLRGPRQVGKTTLQQQIIRHLLEEEEVDPRQIFHVQFDELPRLAADELPILMLCYWFEQKVLEGSLNQWAHRGTPVYLFFDEVRNLEAWAPQMKSLVDHHSVRVLLTGSSAFRIERGRDSLAGRITTMEMGTFLLREISALRSIGELEPAVELNGYADIADRDVWIKLRDEGRRRRKERDLAFAAFAERGGYPFAQMDPDLGWNDLADRLNETVVRRVLHHDLQLLEETTDSDLLEEIFRIACRYAGQDPGPRIFVPELRKALERDVDYAVVIRYLGALDESLVLRRIPPVELRLRRQEQRHKICLCDHSLRASWLGEKVALAPEALARDPSSSRLAGPLAESVVGCYLRTLPGLDVFWYPPRRHQFEIDFLLVVGDWRIPVEVKYRIDPRRDVEALCSFVDDELNRAPFGLLVTLSDDFKVDDPRVVALPLSSFLLLR